MKIAIIETAHFQYAITISELFPEAEKLIFTTEDYQNRIKNYCDHISNFSYCTISSVANNYKEIIERIINENIDLLFINPIFNSYNELNKLVKSVSCQKVLTTHNINTWFNGRFWSPASFMDRVNMKSIIKNCDYIAVEDFIYEHLTSTKDKRTISNQFIYIPFTIYHPGRKSIYTKPDEKLRIVLTGQIDGARRRYEIALEVIEYFANRSNEIHFTFAGRSYGEYGREIQNKLDKIDAKTPYYVAYFPDDSTAEMFRETMEISDVVLSMSNLTFAGMGTTEYIGKTKPTAAIHDMMTFELPGLLPKHLKVPKNLTGSVFNYSTGQDIIDFFEEILTNRMILNEYKKKAAENSLNFTPEKIRKQLPF